MNSEIMIKITPVGNGKESEIKDNADSLPKPESGMGRGDDRGEVSTASVPAPDDSFGSGRVSTGTQGAPAPSEVQSSTVKANANAVPEPVELEEVESLGKSDSTNPPDPE